MENTPLRVDKLDVSKIKFASEKDGINDIPFGFIRYDNKSLTLRTPTIITEAYGIPRAGAFYKTDKSRAFYKMPLCHDRRKFPEEIAYDEIKASHDKLKELDTICASEKFRREMFGDKHYHKYNYIPIVRNHQEDEEDSSKEYYRPPYVKLKLPVYDDIYNLYLYKENVEGKVAYRDINDLASEVKYLGKVSFILKVNKLFIMNTAGSSCQNKNYGITIIATHVKVYHRENMNRYYNDSIIAFDDDDDDDKPLQENKITRSKNP